MSKTQPEKEQFQLIVTYLYVRDHWSDNTCTQIVDNKLQTWDNCFTAYIPSFLQKVSFVQSNNDNSRDILNWFRSYGYFTTMPYRIRCYDHVDCYYYKDTIIQSVQLVDLFGTINQKRLITFILGMDKQYGQYSSINTCFNSELGDTHILHIIKDYLYKIE